MYLHVYYLLLNIVIDTPNTEDIRAAILNTVIVSLNTQVFQSVYRSAWCFGFSYSVSPRITQTTKTRSARSQQKEYEKISAPARTIRIASLDISNFQIHC